jgi:hypothetical protein
LAGGDASYFAEEGLSRASFGYGFFGIGPADEHHWDTQPGSSIKTMTSGGGVDWRPPKLLNNVRSEIQHMMMVMFLAFKFELPVLYSVGLLHAAEGFNSVLGWTVCLRRNPLLPQKQKRISKLGPKRCPTEGFLLTVNHSIPSPPNHHCLVSLQTEPEFTKFEKVTVLNFLTIIF